MLLYIHIPFCASKCGYCGFNSLTNMLSFKEKYLDSLCIDLKNELNLWESKSPCTKKANFSKQIPHFFKKLHSIYIGGGTPNTLNPSDYEKIFSILQKYISPHTEITIELNPNTTKIHSLRHFQQLGINRFSIGVQSFLDKKLKLLERNHNPKIAQKFIENALNCGVSVSIDLIYDLNIDSKKSLAFELEMANNLGIGHISCYALSLEKHSIFFAKNKFIMRENSLCYELKDILEKYHFCQYEVSNFAKNHKSKHNLGYWAYSDYMGVGLGAVGKITDKNSIRFYKNNDFNAYLNAPNATKSEILNDDDVRMEKIFLGLRSEIGVESSLIPNKERLEILLESKKITYKNGKIFATNYFIADEITLFLS